MVEKVGRREAGLNLKSKCCLQNGISHDVLQLQRGCSSDQTAIAGLQGGRWWVRAGFMAVEFQDERAFGSEVQRDLIRVYDETYR